MKYIKWFLIRLWMLPQDIVGLIVVLVTGAKRFNEYCYVAKNWPAFGVSLGDFIIFGRTWDKIGLQHEYGHQKQSLILGPLYLLIIGLPSLIGNLLWRKFHNFDYYKQPWEAWADKLGGVKR